MDVSSINTSPFIVTGKVARVCYAASGPRPEHSCHPPSDPALNPAKTRSKAASRHHDWRDGRLAPTSQTHLTLAGGIPGRIRHRRSRLLTGRGCAPSKLHTMELSSFYGVSTDVSFCDSTWASMEARGNELITPRKRPACALTTVLTTTTPRQAASSADAAGRAGPRVGHNWPQPARSLQAGVHSPRVPQSGRFRGICDRLVAARLEPLSAAPSDRPPANATSGCAFPAADGGLYELDHALCVS